LILGSHVGKDQLKNHAELIMQTLTLPFGGPALPLQTTPRVHKCQVLYLKLEYFSLGKMCGLDFVSFHLFTISNPRCL